MATLSLSNLVGHNTAGLTIRVQVRLFNSLAKFTASPGWREDLELLVDATVGDLIQRFKLPLHDVFLVLRNGRDINAGLYCGGNVNLEAGLNDGDVIAFSGPVPYSPGYGAPVV